MHSFKDKNGCLFVACSGCSYGGKGDRSCSAGWNIKVFKGEGCFKGELLGKFKEKLK